MRYVYGFTRADHPADELGDGVGEPAGPVELVTEGEVAALVTEVGPEGIAPRRANLNAHADVLRRAHDHGTVLPLRFGIVMEDDDAVRAELSARTAELQRMLASLAGKLEMSVSALYREDVVLREVVAEHPEVARARGAIKDKPIEATHFERIRLGEIVAGAIDAKRAADSGEILRELEAHAVAVAPGNPLHERMVVNAAFLVDAEKLDAFDAAVEETSRGRADRMQFKLVGPLPPHSFVGSD